MQSAISEIIAHIRQTRPQPSLAFESATLTLRREDWGKLTPKQRELIELYHERIQWVDGGHTLQITLAESRLPEILAAGEEGTP